MSSLKKTALIITIITILCKFLGFIREIILAYFYGTSYIVDSYLMASTIPIILFGWLTAIAVAYTPIYTDIKTNISEEKSIKFTNTLITIVVVLGFLCSVFGVIFNKLIVSVTAPGFIGEVYEITAYFLKISIWITMFNATIQILAAYLNCNGHFIKSNLANLAISSTQILFIFISGMTNNSKILIYGVLTSNVLHLIIIYIFSSKINYKYKPNFEITQEIKNALIIVIPIFISSMIMQINIFVDKTFASKLAEGSISALNYADRLNVFMYYVFTIAITTIIYPMLSQAVAEKNMNKVKNIFSKGTNIILILFVPITIGAIILARPAISFVFERGEFGNSSVMMTTSAFTMYSVGLLAVALRDVITKVFYSMQETKSTLFISALALALDIIFNIILIKPMGHAGLALGTSLSAIITIPIFFIVLRKKIGALGLKNTMILFIKSCISTAVMGIVVYFGFNWLSEIFGSGKLSILLSILLSAGIGGIIYFVLMIILKVKEMDFFTDIIKKVVSKLVIRG